MTEHIEINWESILGTVPWKYLENMVCPCFMHLNVTTLVQKNKIMRITIIRVDAADNYNTKFRDPVK